MSLPLGSRWWLHQKGQPARCNYLIASRDGRCHNMATQSGFCRFHLRKQKRGEFLVSAWGIHSQQGLLITCDSRKSAEELLDPGETLVHVQARCIPAKPQSVAKARQKGCHE